MTEPFVSVMTPVYNGGPYLAECIESVLRQTYSAFDYVILDNASTDDSLAIARSYEARDPRVRVVACDEHLANNIENWNRTMELVAPHASYIKVVHADDWIFDECLARMVAAGERYPSAGLVGAYRIDGNRVSLDGLPPSVELVPGRDAARSFLLGGPLPFLFGAPSSLLIRADLVRNSESFYNRENIHADTEVCLRVLAEHDFAFVHQVLTYTRLHEKALTTTWVNRVGTTIPNDVDLFQRFGPVFLSEDEYDRKLVVRLVHYAAFLGSDPRKWLLKEFRQHQRDRLRLILGRTSARRLVRGLRLQTHRSLARSGRVQGTSKQASA